MKSVYVRDSHLEGIKRVKANGFKETGRFGDLLLFVREDTYVEKIKVTSKKILEYVQIKLAQLRAVSNGET